MQEGTQTEVEMTDVDEDRRKDEDTGKVMTYAELLAEHDDNNELAAVAWDMMTDTPSVAMDGLNLGGDQATQQQQQAAELRKYRQQQAVAKKAADEAAAKAADEAAAKKAADEAASRSLRRMKSSSRATSSLTTTSLRELSLRALY